MVDTNSDPREVEYVIPSNDDASKSIDKILSLVTAAIIDGLSNRNADASPEDHTDEAVAEETPEAAAAAPATETVEVPAVEEVAEVDAPATEEVQAKTEE